jgi:hypothetical protein
VFREPQEEPPMTTPPNKQPHIRAVPMGGGHRVGGLQGPEDVVVDEAAAAEDRGAGADVPAVSSPLSRASNQVSTAIARAVAEPIAHAGLAITVGVAGAGVGGLTGRSWTAAGTGAGVNLFLLGLGMAVLGRNNLAPQLRWAYLLLSLLGGAGAGYALWAGSGARRK